MRESKRMPQVGEIWWNRMEELRGPLSKTSNDIYTLEDNRFVNYTPSGKWNNDGSKDCLDLIHIHSDAQGNVINMTFEDKNEDPVNTDEPLKPGPYDSIIADAQQDLEIATMRLAVLRTLKQKEADHESRNASDEAERKAREDEIIKLKTTWV